jgi:hypothetical protein
MADVAITEAERRLIAKNFVQLVQGMYVHFPACLSPKHFDDYERKLLLDVLDAAGFEDRTLEPGVLRGHYLDQDRSRTGKTYEINTRLPFWIKGKNLPHTVGWRGETYDDFRSTIWLDRLWRQISQNDQALASIGLVDLVSGEIEKERPLEPIVFDRYDDRMGVRTRQIGDSSPPIRDDALLESSVGVHLHCEGDMELRHTSPEWNALVCKKCFLRIPIPSELKTLGDLRTWLNPKRMNGEST